MWVEREVRSQRQEKGTSRREYDLTIATAGVIVQDTVLFKYLTESVRQLLIRQNESRRTVKRSHENTSLHKYP